MSRIGPMLLPRERVTIDGDYRPAFRFIDRDGAAIDLTASGVDVWCEMAKDNGTAILRKKSNSGETAYVSDGTDGEIEFIFLAAALAGLSGVYEVDVWYVKSATSVKRKVAEYEVSLEADRT